ncbi:MAG: hypothetical protein ITG00_01915 [Flavobacterium sp.]|nr:hypothetical protein [Flavobacterium sp.]
MNYKYHPILEDLKVNEDGTSIIYKGEVLTPRTYVRKTNTVPSEVVFVGYKVVTVMRVVCECWHGLSENTDFVVRKLDQAKGNHYSNLCWSKQGLSSENFNTLPKFSEEEFIKLKTEQKKDETLTAFLKRKKISIKAYYTAKNRYEQKSQ